MSSQMVVAAEKCDGLVPVQENAEACALSTLRG